MQHAVKELRGKVRAWAKTRKGTICGAIRFGASASAATPGPRRYRAASRSRMRTLCYAFVNSRTTRRRQEAEPLGAGRFVPCKVAWTGATSGVGRPRTGLKLTTGRPFPTSTRAVWRRRRPHAELPAGEPRTLRGRARATQATLTKLRAAIALRL